MDGKKVMRCKLVLNGCEKVATKQGYVGTRPNGTQVWGTLATGVKIKMGAVFEGMEHQKNSENAVFGEATPMAEFNATIHNPQVAAELEAMYGSEFYVDFIEVINEAPAETKA